MVLIKSNSLIRSKLSCVLVVHKYDYEKRNHNGLYETEIEYKLKSIHAANKLIKDLCKETSFISAELFLNSIFRKEYIMSYDKLGRNFHKKC